MFGRKNDTNVDHLRYTILREKSGGRDGKIEINRNVDLSLLPPCKKSLVQHIHRANYQVAIWNRSHIAIQNASKPTEGHGWKLEDGVIKPLWFESPVVPDTVATEVDASDTDNEDDIDEDEEQEDNPVEDDMLTETESEDEY